MARLSNVQGFNLDRQNHVKFNLINDELVVMSKDDMRLILIDYMSNELNFFSENISNKAKVDLNKRINAKIDEIEEGLFQHISDKINDLTEKICSETLTSVINKEVERLVKIRLEEIKEKNE